MADGPRLYAFTSGTVRAKVHLFKMHQGLGEEMDIPIPFFLVTHPRGNVLIDGGNALGVAKDPYHWGRDVAPYYWPTMSEDEHCVAQLRRLGIAPADIHTVVQTHLHVDHCGALGHFPDARFIVMRRELEYAYTHDWFYYGQYHRQDFDHPVDWTLLEPSDDGYDVHGDGVVRMLFTPGHTPGQCSVVVTLPNTGPVMLTSDACFTLDHYENRALPGSLYSAGDVVRSVARIRAEVKRTGALVVPGHDLEAWNGLKHAPSYYD